MPSPQDAFAPGGEIPALVLGIGDVVCISDRQCSALPLGCEAHPMKGGRYAVTDAVLVVVLCLHAPRQAFGGVDVGEDEGLR
jgi:hypothetical protein